MDYDTREITQVTFGIYSAKEILEMAVCHVNNPKKSGPNTVYDARMGTTDSTQLCETCKENAYECQGHFGYIELNEPIIHPLYYKRVVKLLNCFCFRCNRLLLMKEQIYLSGMNRYKGEARFVSIQERLKTVQVCCQPGCGAEHPRCKFSISDSSIFKVYQGKDKVRTSIVLPTAEILKMFDNILDEDVRLIGLDPELVHPRNFIITMLPVIPPCDRPYVRADGNMCDDDITNQYCLHGDTKVMLWTGKTKLARNIEVGDTLLGSDGKPKEVLDTCTGKSQMYRVCQRNGDDYVVNGKHKLSLKIAGHRSLFWSKAKNAWQMLWFDADGGLVGAVSRRILTGFDREQRITYVTEKVSREQAREKIEVSKSSVPNMDIIDITVEDYLQLNQSTRQMLMGYKVGCFKGGIAVRTAIEVEPVGIDQYYGFELKGKNKRFALGDFTVTHNCEIIKANNHLGNYGSSGKKELSENRRQKFLASLRFRILTTFNNGQGKAKHSTNGRPIKGIKERLAGKDGQLRNNMMGKRSVRPDTPIMIFKTGKTKRAEDIVIGDVVVGDDGRPRTVVDTVSGVSPLYKVKQYHGDDYGISCEHILTLKYCGHSKIHWRPKQGSMGGYFISWYDRSTKKVKSKKVSAETPFAKDDACNAMVAFLKDNDLSDKVPKWYPKRKRAGTWRVCYTKDCKKKSKEFAVVHGKTKEQCLREMEEFRSTINVDPMIDIHVKDYLKLPKTHQRCMLGTKLRVPIQWPASGVQICPRLVGMWLVSDNHKRFLMKGEPLLTQLSDKPSSNDVELVVCKLRSSFRNVVLPKACVYRIGNSVNNKFYIGSTSQLIERRLYEHLHSNYTKKFGREIENSEKATWHIDSLKTFHNISRNDLTREEGRVQNHFYKTSPDLILNERIEKKIDKNGPKTDSCDGEVTYECQIRCTAFQKFIGDAHVNGEISIPEEYVVNSEQVRRKVLAGMVDYIGSVEQKGTTIRINANYTKKRVLYGAQRIARSLGLSARMHERKTCFSEHTGNRTQIQLTISGAGIEKIPTLLSHKECSPPRSTDMCSTKIEIVEDGVGKFCGFEVDQNNRFLLGDCTITHNCNQTGRTVIGPDPTLKMGQLAVPPQMAEVLTVPVRVASFNIEHLQGLVDAGEVNSLLKPDGKTRINLKRFRRGTRLLAGDIIHRGDQRIEVVACRELVQKGDLVERNGEFLKKLLHANRSYRLKMGWIVERKLSDGDYVLLNRQPTEPLC